MDVHPSSLSDPDETALAWLTRLRGSPTSAELTAFEQWLAASPAHRAAWRRAESLWSSIGDAGARVAEEDAEQLSTYLEKMDRAKRRRAVRRSATIASLVLAVAAGALWLERPHFFQDLTADYVSARGERRLVALSDGSTVLLDADSALDVD
jgi:transmembrane sensor